MALGGVYVQLLLFLNLGTRRGWVVSITPRPRFTPGKRAPGIHCVGGWEGPKPGWAQRVEEKYSASVRDRTPAVQSVVRHYTDWATPALVFVCTQTNLMSDVCPRCKMNNLGYEQPALLKAIPSCKQLPIYLLFNWMSAVKSRKFGLSLIRLTPEISTFKPTPEAVQATLILNDGAPRTAWMEEVRCLFNFLLKYLLKHLLKYWRVTQNYCEVQCFTDNTKCAIVSFSGSLIWIIILGVSKTI
jgi:hypothetical protein